MNAASMTLEVVDLAREEAERFESRSQRLRRGRPLIVAATHLLVHWPVRAFVRALASQVHRSAGHLVMGCPSCSNAIQRAANHGS